MKRKWLIWTAVGVVVLLILTVRVKVQGPYLGKVVDKETGRPLEGAAVVAVWVRSGAGIVQRISFLQEVQETVTDQQGHFTIPGTWGVQVTPLVEIKEPAPKFSNLSSREFRGRSATTVRSASVGGANLLSLYAL